MWRLLAVAALLGCSACAVRKTQWPTYRLVHRDAAAVLVPPGVAGPELPQRRFPVDIKPGGSPCPPAGDAVHIETGRKRVYITVRPNRLAAQPPGWLSSWAAEMEAQGCVAAGEGSALASRIAESVPLALNEPFRLLHPNDVTTGWLDVGSDTRLRVVSPIFREGAPPDASALEAVVTPAGGNNLTVTVKASADLLGYETAWYDVRPAAGRPGFTIVPLYAERHIQGEVERAPRPGTNHFPFAPAAAFYRLYYKADPTEFTALVVAGRTSAELERNTGTLDSGAASCEKLSAGFCVTVPRQVAVNPLIAVTVNGQETLVNRRATLHEAIRAAGESQPAGVLSTLSVSKPHHGRLTAVEFDPDDPTILRMILRGGEVIRWK